MARSTWIETLEKIVGSDHVLTRPDADPFAVDEKPPQAVVFPGAVEEVASVMALASAAELKVTPWGSGSQMALGATPERVDLVVALKRLNRVVDHEWGDMTATVQGGMPLEDMQQILAAHHQFLPVDPPSARRATVGGLLATNASGPRRYFYGTARDLLIAIKVVHADGSVTKGGAKVVKNVTGYDMNKLYIGSLGTLGIIVEATFRVYPQVSYEKTWLAPFPALTQVEQAVAQFMGSPLVANALQLLDAEAARRIIASARIDWAAGHHALAVSVGSVAEEAVDAQLDAIGRICRKAGSPGGILLDGEPHHSLWRRIRHLAPGANGAAPPRLRAVLKGAVLISRVTEAIRLAEETATMQHLDLSAVADAGSGIVRLYVSGEGHTFDAFVERAAAMIEPLRNACVAQGGSLIILEAAPQLKSRVDVWGPVKGLALMRGIKARFDPGRTLNPGRFVGGI